MTIEAGSGSAAGAAAQQVPAAAFHVTVASLFRKQVRMGRTREALVFGTRSWTYGQLDERTNRLAAMLTRLGGRRGEQVAVLSENRPEYLELEIAAAKLGMAVACLNWRSTEAELAHCTSLAEPIVFFASARFDEQASRLRGNATLVSFDRDYEEQLQAAGGDPVLGDVDPEDPLVVLYTSGTTGLPKGAIVSQRAMVARMQVFQSIIRPMPDETFPAWAPLFHMASTDHSLATLMIGGTVALYDGLDLDGITVAVGARQLSWLIAMPGMIDQLIDALREKRIRPLGLRAVGAMADLVPRHRIAELTRLLDAPYVNTFGSTEAGLAPASGSLLPPGIVPETLSKLESSLCDIRLVDDQGSDVADGEPGELLVRGPTLFSGYLKAPDVNKRDFRGGWFRTGDLFRRNGNGSLDFTDRVKYLIKTGGENVYPAEIEQVLMRDERVEEAVVVRRPDPTWGEVPVAFVVCSDAGVTAKDLLSEVADRLARYKVPKEIRIVGPDALPRSTTGKILRHEVEQTLL